MLRSLLTSLMVLVVVTVAFTGCTQRIGDFTMVTTKNYEYQVKYKMVGRMEGKDLKMIIFIPIGIPDLKNAVDRAIEAGNGVYLANAVIETYNWFFIIGQTGYVATGDVYAPADRGDLLDPNIEKFELRETENGLVMQSTSTEKTVAVQDGSQFFPN